MIALVDTTIATECDFVLRNMFAARKRVFVDLLNWDVPVIDGAYELDQFDDEHARYLVLTDGECRHLGSARLLPTTRAHILDTLFPALCAGPIPTGPDTFEITRFCLDLSLAAAERRQIRDRLMTALTEHAQANAIATYTGVAEPAWLRQILDFGWEARTLGQPLPIDGRKLGALRIEITPDTPSLLAARGIWLPTRNVEAAAADHARA
jgi:acyl-homoserine lactone synthase